ncbi:MAG: hypothetical protein N3D82_00410 [Ignisphaera sp.]|nr:hypothetical protein [Ignisphaera sp.]MCX8167478.1 hypothetical protein [Ignisphaera sp.]MDW8084658.1 hypothetical protein [Ignisphaera sp.]
MPVNLRALITASTVPLLKYSIYSRSIWNVGKLLTIRSCSEMQKIMKLYLNYIKLFENNSVGRVIITPPIGIAPYVATLEHSQVLPNSILAFVKRTSYSNPLNFKLFLEDIELCMEGLRRSVGNPSLNELKRDVVFIYGPMALNELEMNYIPLIILVDLDRVASRIFQTSKTSVFNVEFEDFAILKKDNEYSILMLDRLDRGAEHTLNSNNDNTSATDPSVGGYHTYRTCSPIACIKDLDIIDESYEFKCLEELAGYLLKRGKGTHMYIEFWSSYTALLERESKGYYYLWMPHIDGNSTKRLVKFIMNGGLPTPLNKVTLVSPLRVSAELGSISDSRVWLSIIIEQIAYSNNNIIEANLIA